MDFLQKNKKVIVWSTCIIVAVTFIVNTAQVAPFNAFDGAAWFKNGFHFMSASDMNQRIRQTIDPQESATAEKIKKATHSCNDISDGFCQRAAGDYYLKTITKQAVAYKAAVPDEKQVTGYCTLCNDGTLSPSCATGRGACSWHGGVAAYGVASYRIIRGSLEVNAVPAEYSYTSAHYQESPNYTKPIIPSLSTIVGYSI